MSLVIATAASGVKRTQHYVYDSQDVLRGPTHLLEMARTNLVLRSQELSTAPWTNSGTGGVAPAVTADVSVAPDGTTTMDRIDLSGTTTARYGQSLGVNGANNTYTLSFWARLPDGVTNEKLPRCQLRASIGVGDLAINAAITGLTSTPQRFSYTGTFSASPGGSNFAVLFVSLTTASAETCQVEVWGVQVEAGAFASAYIPTTSGAVTRVADNCSYAIPDAMQPAAIAAAGGAAWYTDVIASGTAQALSARLWQVGSADNTGARILVDTHTSGRMRARWFDALGTERVSTLDGVTGGAVAIGNRVETLVFLGADGGIRIHQRVGGGAVVLGDASAALALDGEWGTAPAMHINSVGSTNHGRNAFIPNTHGQEVTYLPGLPALGLTATAAMDYAAARHTG
jgi:hypothetical protein